MILQIDTKDNYQILDRFDNILLEFGIYIYKDQLSESYFYICTRCDLSSDLFESRDITQLKSSLHSLQCENSFIPKKYLEDLLNT